MSKKLGGLRMSPVDQGHHIPGSSVSLSQIQPRDNCTRTQWDIVYDATPSSSARALCGHRLDSGAPRLVIG